MDYNLLSANVSHLNKKPYIKEIVPDLALF